MCRVFFSIILKTSNNNHKIDRNFLSQIVDRCGCYGAFFMSFIELLNHLLPEVFFVVFCDIT